MTEEQSPNYFYGDTVPANDDEETPTLRDMFAMAALQGMLKNYYDEKLMALVSYKYADAMLEARKK